jgi:hypothetical protein
LRFGRSAVTSFVGRLSSAMLLLSGFTSRSGGRV